MSIKAFFKPAEKPAEAVAAPVAVAAREKTQRYEVRFTRSSRVDQWDENQFVDCRPSEARDAMDGVCSSATQHDESDVLLGHVRLNNFDNTGLQPGPFSTLEEANAAAREMVNFNLVHPEGVHNRAKQEACSDADFPHGYKVPASSCSPEVTSTSADARKTFAGRVVYFCDPDGCDVYNVVVTELSARVVVEGDTSPPPTADKGKAPAGKGKAPAGKGKAPTGKGQTPASKGKAPAGKNAWAVSKKPVTVTKTTRGGSKQRGRGGGAKVLGGPGMSKAQVAAINKRIKASQRLMQDSDDEDYGPFGKFDPNDYL